MASRRKATKKPRPIHIPTVAESASWIESDRYDRRAWAELGAGAESIRALTEAGERLAPHFGALMRDLFLGLFKYNVVWLKPDAVRRGALLNRAILEHLLPSPAFAMLKERTLLEEDKAVLGAIVLGEHALEMLRTEKLANRSELLDLWDLEHQEQDLEQRAAALKNAIELTPETPEPAAPGQPKEAAAAAKKIAELRDAAERAAKVSEARLNQKTRIVEEQLRQADRGELRRIELNAARLAEEIDRVTRDSHDFSREFGQGGRMAASERLELGKRLARNRRIGELARLVGRLKQEARALRRRTLDRGVAETYDVERGGEVGRLIPSELVALGHPALARDFRRRLLEGELLQYRLRADEQKGKGPMVVCIDVSSSMQGDKELWAKAVSLTLMDIARRQRRLFRAVLFAAGAETLKVLDLNRERRYQPELPKVLEMAEYFPGGGTDFQAPLDAAVALIAQRKLKRADIVIITDGECAVAPQWLAELRRSKAELKFSIFSVLVDLGSSATSTLAQFSDRVTSVTRLSDPKTREIFLNV